MTSYPLITRRVRLSPLTEVDAEAFVRYRQVPEVARYQGWDLDFSTADAQSLILGQPQTDLPGEGGWIQLAIHEVESGILLGDVAIHVLDSAPDSYELGVTLAPEAQGRGYATEALSAVRSWLFGELSAHRILAVCDTRNHSVAALFERLGFRKEGVAVESEHFKGEWVSLATYAQLLDEFMERASL